MPLEKKPLGRAMQAKLTDALGVMCILVPLPANAEGDSSAQTEQTAISL